MMVAFSDFDDAEAWDDVTRGNDDWDAVFMKAEAQEKALKSSSGQSVSATTYSTGTEYMYDRDNDVRYRH